MAATLAPVGYDPKVFTVCAPWTGKKGIEFTQRFWPSFRNGLMGISDKYSTLLDTLDDVDQGGAGPGAPPLLLGLIITKSKLLMSIIDQTILYPAPKKNVNQMLTNSNRTVE